MRKLLLGAAATAVLFAAGAANAAVTVQIFTDQVGAATDATLAQAAGLGAPQATVSVAGINFTNSPGDNSDVSTVGEFLNNPAGLDPGVAGHTLDNTYLFITGSTFLHSGANSFAVSHDDGLQLSFDGGIGLVVDQPGPHSPTLTPFTVNAPHDGNFSFELSYGECCGGPAELILDLNGAAVGSGAPEPASWALMMVGFGGLGAMLRRRRSVALTA